MIRLPPRSTLFPTRRSSDLKWLPESRVLASHVTTESGRHLPPPEPRPVLRSEEHTSELQSQSNLVCRLLLGKKKSTQFRHIGGHKNIQRPAHCTMIARLVSS